MTVAGFLGICFAFGGMIGLLIALVGTMLYEALADRRMRRPPFVVEPRYTSHRYTSMTAEEWQRLGEKSRALLLRFLDHEQGRDYQTTGRFNVVGRSGHYYRIGGDGFVTKLTRVGVPTECWCIGFADFTIPREDLFLAQMLHLKEDDRAMRRIANVFGP